MQFISSCTIFLMMVLNIICADNKNWNLTCTPSKITAVPGLCALVSCTITYPDTVTAGKTIDWKIILLKNENTNKDFERVRYKIHEPELNKNNFSFTLKDIKADDAGKYTLTEGDATATQIKPSRNFKIIIRDKPVIEVPPLRERKQANLSCSAPSPCPETPPKITWWITKRNGGITEVKNENYSTTSEGFYNSTLILTPTSELHNATVGCNVSYGDKKNISTNKTIEVMRLPTIKILGNNAVNEGDTLRLSCTVDSHPASSDPVWTLSGTTDKLMNQTSPGNLTFNNVSTQLAGEYVCTVNYMNMTWNKSININVVRHTNADDENMTLCITRNITVLLSFLTGMAISAVFFPVILCCNESYKRSKAYEMIDTNIETTVVMEVFYDQEKQLHKKW